MSDYVYPGVELDTFSHATNWKTYFSKKISPYIHGRVLEVGAGLGTVTKVLTDKAGFDKWVCIEPDKKLFSRLQGEIRQNKDITACNENIYTIDSDERFDTILYIDVLEHIEDDRSELERAVSLLNPGGTVIVLSPAFNFVFSNFDSQVGHLRRYDRSSLKALASDYKIKEIFYLDSMGLVLSLMNKILLKKSNPSIMMIKVWDKIVVPFSRFVDPLLGCSFGRSVVAIIENK